MSTLHADGEIIDRQTVRFERLLPGPIERVWAYLTESEKRRKWLASGDMDLRVGGRAALRFNHSELTPHQEVTPEKYREYDGSTVVYWEITRCEPPRLLAARWGENAEEFGSHIRAATPRQPRPAESDAPPACRPRLHGQRGGWMARPSRHSRRPPERPRAAAILGDPCKARSRIRKVDSGRVSVTIRESGRIHS